MTPKSYCLENCPYYNSRVVIYTRKMFIKLPTGLSLQQFICPFLCLSLTVSFNIYFYLSLNVHHIQFTFLSYSSKQISLLGGCHSSAVSFAPTILRPRVRIPSTTFSICIIEIVMRKGRNLTKEAGIVPFLVFLC